MARFMPGQSGNPSGRPKQTASERKTLGKLKKLTDRVPETLQSLLDDDKTPAPLKVKICEMLLDRTFGKAIPAVSETTSPVEVNFDFIVSADDAGCVPDVADVP